MSVKKPAPRKSAATKSAATKPVDEKPPNGQPDAPATSAAEADADLHTKAYTLPGLCKRTAAGPKITAEQVMVYVDASPEQLVALGKEVRTERIDLDSARLYGTAYDFFLAATAEQRAALPGLTKQRLRVSIWAAAQGQAKNRAMIAAEERNAAEQSYRTTDAKQVKEKARGVRDVLHGVLFALAAGQKLRVEELRDACRRSEKPQDLAASLVDLAGLLDRYQSDPDPKLAVRRAEMQLDGSLAQQARALAEQVVVRGSAEKAPRAATSNADVDLWDGINLHLLDQMVTFFDAGHSLVPTVPRLQPLALRGWFGTYVKKSKPTEPSQPSA